VDLAVRAMLEDAVAAARDLLKARIDDLEKGARLLIERETITPDDFAPLRRTAEREFSALSPIRATVSRSTS